MGVIKTIDQIEIKIKILNPSEEPKHPPKPHAVFERCGHSLLFQKQDRDTKVGTFVCQSQWPHQNQEQDAKLQFLISSKHVLCTSK